MRGLLLILITIICSSTGCFKSKEKVEKESASGIPNVETKQVENFNCAKIKQTLKESIIVVREDFDRIDIKGLKKVDKDFYENVLLGKVFDVPYSQVQLYFYSYSNLTDCSIVLLKIEEIDEINYQMYLVNLNGNGKLRSHLLIAGRTPYPDGEEFTRSMYSRSDDIIQIILRSSVGEYDKSLDKYSMIVDSIGNKYSLSKSGAFQLVRKDSTRLIKN